MPTQAIISDFQLGADCSFLSGRVDATGTCRLFKNAWTPTNNMVLGSFSECTFAGYLPIPMVGRSRGARQLSVGIWEVLFGSAIFAATGGPSQFVNGWYLTDSFGNVLAAQPLPVPRPVAGGFLLGITVRLQVRGLNIACP